MQTNLAEKEREDKRIYKGILNVCFRKYITDQIIYYRGKDFCGYWQF